MKPILLQWLFFFSFAFFNRLLAASESDSLVTSSSESSSSGVTAAPFLKFAPETGLAGGVVGLYYFRTDALHPDDRPSSVSGGITYTAKKQISTGVDYDFYFNRSVDHLSGGFDYKKIPFDFYGIGNHNPSQPLENYTPLWIGGDAEFTINIFHTLQGEGLNVGIAAEVRHDALLIVSPNGVLASGSVAGSKGGLSSGLGVAATYDTRDNTFSSRTGNYLDGKLMFYGKALGSDFSFTRFVLDSRKFIPVFKQSTVAVQGYLCLASTGEPFYTMAELGGDSNMRGYIQGRYRDLDMMMLQAEYRTPLIWRFGFAGFADYGDVSGGFGQFKLTSFKYSVGAGIRFAIVPDERLNVRLDYGIGKDSSEIYFSILEAF
jgi:outer membrane protein assembly factor BamA